MSEITSYRSCKEKYVSKFPELEEALDALVGLGFCPLTIGETDDVLSVNFIGHSDDVERFMAASAYHPHISKVGVWLRYHDFRVMTVQHNKELVEALGCTMDGCVGGKDIPVTMNDIKSLNYLQHETIQAYSDDVFNYMREINERMGVSDDDEDSLDFKKVTMMIMKSNNKNHHQYILCKIIMGMKELLMVGSCVG